jgi:hypothetical protein
MESTKKEQIIYGLIFLICCPLPIKDFWHSNEVWLNMMSIMLGVMTLVGLWLVLIGLKR